MSKDEPKSKSPADKAPSRAAQKSPKLDPWGCMAGTVTFMPDVDLTAPSGEIWNAEKGRSL